MIAKAITISSNLLLVNILFNGLGSDLFSIWIIITSLIAWTSFFDLGLGNGLRNSLSVALGKKLYTKASILVSTAYFIIFIVAACACFLIVSIIPILDLNNILSIDNKLISPEDLNSAITIITIGFAIRLFTGLINSIYYAIQRPSVVDYVEMTVKLLQILIVFLLQQYSVLSIIDLSWIFGIIVFVTPGIFSLITFIKLKEIKLKTEYIKLSHAPELLQTGFKFLLVQIIAISIYQSNYLLISHYLENENIVKYNLYFNLYLLLNTATLLVIGPIWSVVTEAKSQGDEAWLKNLTQNLKKIWLGILFFGIVITIFQKTIFHIWVGEKFKVDFYFGVLFLVLAMSNIWNTLISHYLNGLKIIKPQIAMGTISFVLITGLGIILINYLGLYGIILSNVISSIIANIYYSNTLKSLG